MGFDELMAGFVNFRVGSSVLHSTTCSLTRSQIEIDGGCLQNNTYHICSEGACGQSVFQIDTVTMGIHIAGII